ncbi:hypothetical protein ElyMa_002159700 [Elysia marginata]|uniref:Uncharacterized protein n=1 Tax=Elysia marginata TaxID=1093978 RepID=A0AAV4FPX9_9GAST|nr:hypothetical protein ElyMa_002159700 [Elysia marginata]
MGKPDSRSIDPRCEPVSWRLREQTQRDGLAEEAVILNKRLLTKSKIMVNNRTAQTPMTGKDLYESTYLAVTKENPLDSSGGTDYQQATPSRRDNNRIIQHQGSYPARDHRLRMPVYISQ